MPGIVIDRADDRPYGPTQTDYEYDKSVIEQMEKTPPVRFSHLRAYGRSPMHGHAARMNDDGKSTRDMERGTAVHAILFGNKKVCGYPGSQRRGKDFEAFALEHPDHEILTMSEYDKANRMADAVRACELARPYLQGVPEATLLFRWMGLDCRATPDIRGTDFVTELKTSSSSDPQRFIWHARRMAYHAQLRFQEYACEANRMKVRDHWIVCVESEPPHPVTVFHLEPDARDEAEKLLSLWGERMKACESSGQFPPYVQSVVPLAWPKNEEFVFAEEE